jgi:tetratricopeptide (TPR) repeat protein
MGSKTAKRSTNRVKATAVAKTRDHSRWFPALILIAATLAAFWPVCINDFTTWDDTGNVAQNIRLNPVTLDGVVYFWTHPHMAIYIPLTYTVWGVLASVARVAPDASGISLNPYIFHAANLFVHLISALVAFRLLEVLTRRTWPAVAGALLFALHPVQVESVAWVAGMKDVLCGALSLVALWQYVLFASPDDPGQEPRTAVIRRIHYAAATLAFVLAMLAKPSGMTVPLAALMVDRFLLHRPWRKIAMALLPWLILALACAIVAKLAQPVTTAPDGGRIWARPLLAGEALAFYLFKLVWPARLAVQYHQSPEVILAGRWFWIAWLVPATLAILGWLYRKRWPWLLVSFGLLVAATLPVLGLVPFQFERLSLVADHYLYLAMIGPALAVSFLLASVRATQVAAIICSAALGVLAVRSNLQTWHWRDTVTLFTHELTVNPYSEVAYNGLADRAIADKDPVRAEQLARQATELNPTQGEAYITLGSALSLQRKRGEAELAYRRACQLLPDNPVGLNDLAGVLADRGDLDEAMPLCRRSLELDEFLAPAHRNMAVMLAHQNRFPEALREAQMAVQIDPAMAENQMTLAFLQAATGQRDAAIERLRQLLTLHPDFVPAQRLLGELSRPSQ